MDYLLDDSYSFTFNDWIALHIILCSYYVWAVNFNLSPPLSTISITYPCGVVISWILQLVSLYSPLFYRSSFFSRYVSTPYHSSCTLTSAVISSQRTTQNVLRFNFKKHPTRHFWSFIFLINTNAVPKPNHGSIRSWGATGSGVVASQSGGGEETQGDRTHLCGEWGDQTTQVEGVDSLHY